MTDFDPSTPPAAPQDQPAPPALQQPAPPANLTNPEPEPAPEPEPEPVTVDSSPFVVKASDQSEGDRYGVVVGTTDIDYDLPPKGDGSVEHVHGTHLLVAWFDGSVSQIDADDVERPELS